MNATTLGIFLAWLAVVPAAAAQPVAGTADGVGALLRRIEQVLESGDPAGFQDLLSGTADRTRATEFAEQMVATGVTRAVVREQDRAALPGTLPDEGYRLMVEVLTESGSSGRLATWRLDVRRVARGDTAQDDVWRIADEESLTLLDGIYRLALNPQKQYAVRHLTITAEDLSLRLDDGSAFVAETKDGMAAIVLMGHGEMRFEPTPAAERGQVAIFCGAAQLQVNFDAAFVRINAAEYESRISQAAFSEQPVDAGDLKRAQALFDEHVRQSFALDLSDLSRDTWSLSPSPGDFLAEVRTKRFGTLTYARAGAEAEDVTLFDRKKKRNIAVYASQQKLSRRGRFYSEDDLADYDVLDYLVEASFYPDRTWIEGRTRLKLKIRAYALATLTLRLNESLVVSSVASDQFGRLLFLRALGQNSLIVSLPSAVPRDSELTLTVNYGGRLPPQPLDREAIALQEGQSGRQIEAEQAIISPEPRYLYSNRSYWYPQSTVTDYATATLRLTVPADYDCVASGEPQPETPSVLISGASKGQPAPKLYVFLAPQPLRYLACVISRFSLVASAALSLRPPGAGSDREVSDGGPRSDPRRQIVPGVFYNGMTLSVEANPRQQGRGRDFSERAADILRFYTSLVGDVPYPSFTLALTDSELPGGHSPAYFAVLNQPLPTSPFVWRNDPVNFDSYPQFFLAHELAHQWWGQAVGWKNYHEQWLSEGFAQYFAALYAERHRGNDVFFSILRQIRRWAMEHSDQGPVYLGYRLGHIRGESRIFRALVYNKGAAVLHMLRRLIGDEAFFRGVRRFYAESRFKKAGTEDLRLAFEAEAGISLERFFERWIYESGLPRLKFSYRIAPGAEEAGEAARPGAVVLRFEQTGEIFDVPVTVTLTDTAGRTKDVIVAVTDRVVEVRVPFSGTPRKVEANRDSAALAQIIR